MGGLLPSVFDNDEADIYSGKSLDETARQIQGFAPQDATYIISTGTLVLGIVFTITTLALYSYYYATTFDFKKGENRDFSSRKGKIQTFSFVEILRDLEETFAKFGIPVEDNACQKKIVCETLLPDAREKNAKVADILADILNRGFDTSVSHKGEDKTEEHKQLNRYLNAARTGHKEKTCKKYDKDCPDIHLNTLAS